MKIRAITAGTTLALVGLLGLASANPLDHSVNVERQVGPSYQIAQDEHHEMYREHHDDDDWYQGQRGHWDRDHDHPQWRGTQGDQWYQGQPGHWYQERNGWQFGSTGMICNNQGRNCHQGGYLPANGEGMVSRSNPNMFWACDSHGHNCHWARRPR